MFSSNFHSLLAPYLATLSHCCMTADREISHGAHLSFFNASGKCVSWWLQEYDFDPYRIMNVLQIFNCGAHILCRFEMIMEVVLEDLKGVRDGLIAQLLSLLSNL